VEKYPSPDFFLGTIIENYGSKTELFWLQ